MVIRTPEFSRRKSIMAFGRSLARSPSRLSPSRNRDNNCCSENVSAPQLNELSPEVRQYCMGEPQLVGASSSKHVELYVALQERAIFLPPRDELHEDDLTSRDNDTSQEDGTDHSLFSRPLRQIPLFFSGHQRSSSRDSSLRSTSQAASSQTTLSQVSGFTSSLADDDTSVEVSGTPLRGSIVLKLTKPTRIKEIGLDVYAVSSTRWNLATSQPSALIEPMGNSSADAKDTVYLGAYHWDFVPIETYGAASLSFKKYQGDSGRALVTQDLYGADTVLTFEKENKRKVLTRRVSRCLYSPSTKLFQAGQVTVPVFSTNGPPVYKLPQHSINGQSVVLPPGEYVYNFAILIDASAPESVSVPSGSVCYLVAPRVVRAGKFSHDVTGATQIDLVRSPSAGDEGSEYTTIALSRIWDDRLVYSISLDQPHLTLDVTTYMTITLMSLSEKDVMVHQVRVCIVEIVKYEHSAHPGVRDRDLSLKLVLFQETAPTITSADHSKSTGSLFNPTEPTDIRCPLLVATKSDKPMTALPQSYRVTSKGQKRFLQPDAKSKYIHVKHRLVVTLRVSKMDNELGKRNHYEVRIDTPITVLSKHCVQENLNLPTYYDLRLPVLPEDLNSNNSVEDLPSFDQALEHRVIGTPWKNFASDEKAIALDS